MDISNIRRSDLGHSRGSGDPSCVIPAKAGIQENGAFNRYLLYSLALHFLFFVLTIFLIPRAAPLTLGLTEVSLYRENAGPTRGADMPKPVIASTTGPAKPEVAPAQPEGGRQGGIQGPAANRRLISAEYPQYPAWAQARGLEMAVTVRFWVSSEGKVKKVETVSRSGWLDVDQEVENKVAKWLFEPLPAGLKTEDQWGQVTIKFRLTD